MSLDQVTVEGILKPDGTLALDEKPSLPPGRVTVTVRQTPASPHRQRTLADVIDKIQRGQQARGYQGRSAEEIEAGLREGEEEYERKVQALRDQTTPTPPAGQS